ncbi:MAG: amidohydrolase [Proteobacteria bacterium]|nr:amidohydrolase [Pseudomonadota bacterium]
MSARGTMIGLWLSLGLWQWAAAAPPPADLLLLHGAIYTVDQEHPWAQAVAVRAGKIEFVGSDAAAAAYRGSATQVVDLKGRFAMPGLVDIHEHPVMGGLKTLYECNFPFTAKPADIAAAVKACAAKAAPGAWVRGGQWGSSFFVQNKLESPRAFLDAVSGDHPVYLYDDSGHNGWANSAALKAAQVDKSTPDPAGGTIVRDAKGEPNGVLLETGARVFDKVIPRWNDEQFKAAAREAVREDNQYGLTAMKDAGAPFDASGLAFSSLDKAGELTMDVAVCARTPYGDRKAPLDYAAIETQRERFRTAHVHTEFVKLFLDGVPTEARTAAMLEPYVADAAHGAHFKGELHIDPALLARDVTELDKRGFTVKMHAAGDGSVHAGLDAVAAARKANGNSGLHHELAHAGYVEPSDIPRFAQLDVIPDFSPIIWYPSPIIQSVINAVGPRGQHYWPTRDLLKAGALIATGSDWPAAVPDQNPWMGIEALVTRKDPRGITPGSLWPEQAVSLDEALKIYTLNGARALRLESRIGSLQPGKSAQIIVLDRNPFKIPAADIGDTQVRMTYFEGKLVYSSER